MKKIINFITKNKAFTLTEMVVTIAVIITLAVVWAFYGRGHVKYAMMNEGRLFIEKIVAQEREYRSENGSYLSVTNTAISPALYIDTRENKYFSAFRVIPNGNNITAILRYQEKANVAGVDAITGIYNGNNDSIEYTEVIDNLNYTGKHQ